jgi:response regulator RpfG family c-di-GMP phosphodiesterase
MNYKILVVDDEAANLRLLERLFRHQFNVFTASSGAEALEILKLHDVALIITDQRMPEMTGVEFLKLTSELRPNTIRIILTGYTDVHALIEAINSGVVYKYVTKPWVNEDLQQTVVKALEHYETVKAHYELARQNKRLQLSLKTTLESFVNMAVQMLRLKSPDLPDHCRRTRDYAVEVGRQMGFDQHDLEQLSLAAYLHEVANIGIPNQILGKAKELTAEERQFVKQRFERELQILANVPDLEDIDLVIRYQHENYDGSGFLAGLCGEQIPLHSRIIAVANKYDEMVGLGQLPDASKGKAVDFLKAETYKKFDPEIVKVFCQLDSVRQNTDAAFLAAGNRMMNGRESLLRQEQLI